MPRPKLITGFSWERFEREVLEVFQGGLELLAAESSLPQGEEPINLALYWKCREVHHARLHAGQSIPFFIMFDAKNQPEPDDTVRAQRLAKRPDFACALTNPQAQDYRKCQVIYSVECKRLGAPAGTWVFNSNYAEHGIARFIKVDFGYAKGTGSAAMIGYAQSMPADDVLAEVNANASSRRIPSLTLAATGWRAKAVTVLEHAALTRDDDGTQVHLKHLWVDLRHVTFTTATRAPATAPATKKKRPKKKAGVRASRKAKQTASTSKKSKAKHV